MCLSSFSIYASGVNLSVKLTFIVVFEHRRKLTHKNGGLSAHMASAEREFLTGPGGGAPAGSRDRTPGQGVRGRSPLKLKASIIFYGCKLCANMLVFVIM